MQINLESLSNIVKMSYTTLLNVQETDQQEKENVKFTTPIQQLYNNPSYEGGSHILGPTLM
jgi:hypothetical protein